MSFIHKLKSNFLGKKLTIKIKFWGYFSTEAFIWKLLWNFAYKCESHLFAWPRVVRDVLLPSPPTTPRISYTKAVALDGAESDPSSVLCYRVTTFGGENTGDNVMGATFYCLPTLFRSDPTGEQTVGENFKNKLTGLNQISVPYVVYSRLLIVFFKTVLQFQYPCQRFNSVCET